MMYRQNHREPYVRTWLLAFIFLAVLMAVGSLWDYPISQRLYDKDSFFGLFFAAFGEYPAALGLCAAGSLFFTAGRKGQGLSGGLLILCGVWLFLLGFVLAVSQPGRYLSGQHLPALLTATAACFFFAYGTARLCRDTDRETILRVAAVILTVIVLNYLLVNILKILWGRPRMRLVAADSRVSFAPWWRPGGALRDILTRTGTAADEFKSFPSGHTANASAAMLITLLPVLRPSLGRRRSLLFAVGFGWTALVALSRIVAGAHYLTDTVAGFAIGLAVLHFAVRLILPAAYSQDKKG